MIQATHPAASCPVCSNAAHRFGGAFWRCSACAMIFQYPRPTAEELAAVYNESWQSPDTTHDETGGTTPGLANALTLQLQRMLTRNGLGRISGLTVLEFGAGRGEMAEALVRAGADVWAVEPFGCDYLRSGGIRAVRDIEDLPANLKFDGIVTFDVIEHLIDPCAELTRLRKRLRKGGWLLASTPNARGLNALLTGARWREIHRPTHITMFAPKSLGIALRKSGFASVRRQRWFIGYGARAHRALIHFVLQALGLDGELRVLAINS